MPFAVLRTPDGHRIVATNGGDVGVAKNLPAGSVPFVTTARTIGPNETFTLVPLGNFTFALKTPNGHYVAAPKGGGLGAPASVADGAVALTTNGTNSGPTKTFYIIPISREENAVVLQTENHTYVTAVNGGGIGAPPGYQRDQWPLVTDATELDCNTKFVIHYEPPAHRARSAPPSLAELKKQKAHFAPLSKEAGNALVALANANPGLLQQLRDQLLTGEQLIWGPMVNKETRDTINKIKALPQYPALASAGADHFSGRTSLAFGVNFGVAAVLDIEGFIGFLIDFDGPSAAVIETFEFGIKTNIEAHASLQVAFYFVPAAATLGWGYNFTFSAGEGMEFSAGYTISGGQFAPTAALGAGIGILPGDAAGTASYTWGSTITSLVDPTAAARKRVMVTLRTGDLMYNDGDGDVWNRLSTPYPVFYSECSGTRVAYVTQLAGRYALYAMEGELDPIPAVQYTNVGDFQLIGNRIGIQQGIGADSIIFYKEGALNAGWTNTEYVGVNSWQLIENRLAVKTLAGGNLLVKPKASNSSWVQIATNVNRYTISSDEIIYSDHQGTLFSASGADLNNLTVKQQMSGTNGSFMKQNTMVASKNDNTLWVRGAGWQDEWQQVASGVYGYRIFLNAQGTQYDRLAYYTREGVLYVRENKADTWHKIVNGGVTNVQISFDRIVVTIHDGQISTVHIYEGTASDHKLVAQISGVFDVSMSRQDSF